jgi:hypothetical protein
MADHRGIPGRVAAPGQIHRAAPYYSWPPYDEPWPPYDASVPAEYHGARHARTGRLGRLWRVFRRAR